MSTAFTNTHLLKSTWVTLLVYGYGLDSEKQYAYVRIHGPRLKAFHKAMRKGRFTPAEHGDILAQGTGDPSAELMEYMEAEYDVDHGNMIVLGETS